MQFKSNYRLKGSVGRLIAFASLFTLLFSTVSVMGSAPASAEAAPAEVGAQGASNVSALSRVRLTGALDLVLLLNNSQQTRVVGWACAPDVPGRILRIDVYNMGVSGGQFTREAFLGSLTANVTREPAVGAECGGNRNRGYDGIVRGVCVGQSGVTPVNIRAWAVFSDRGDVLDLPGARLRFNTIC